MKIYALAAAAGLALYAPAANAAVNIYISETGAGVFAQVTGSLDITGLTPAAQATSGLSIRGTQNAFFNSGKPGQTVNAYSGLTGPIAYGSQLMSGTSIYSGISFGFNLGNGRVFLPTDYVSGTEIASTATYQFSTLSSLGLILGDYVYAFNRDSITLHIGEAAPAAVPEPASWMLMLSGFGAIGAAMRRRRKVAVSFG
jgi:hypothetical protein